MKAFLDTSVLVATFYGEHEHHPPSSELFRRLKKTEACTAAHCLAEFYAVVTGMPGKDRATPVEALLFLENVREVLSIAALDSQDYFDLLEGAAGSAIIGGGVFDAIAANCALKANAQNLYTWNVKHFKRLGPDIARRVRTP